MPALGLQRFVSVGATGQKANDPLEGGIPVFRTTNPARTRRQIHHFADDLPWMKSGPPEPIVNGSGAPQACEMLRIGEVYFVDARGTSDRQPRYEVRNIECNRAWHRIRRV